MFYKSFKLLFRFLMWVFFRRIEVEHGERVPQSGPVILVANHPNTMLDPVLIALFSGRNPYFLGKSTLFKNRFTKWFFSSGQVIPIYRKQDAEDQMHRNESSFEKSFEVLEKGHSIVIMPEGISLLDGTIQPLKTGTARIALGVEERNNFDLGLQVIPAGINYSDPTRFNRRVYIRFGKPIHLSDFKELQQNDSVEAVHLLTNQLQSAIQKLTTTVKHPTSAEALHQLQQVYEQELITDLGLVGDSEGDRFIATRGMADAIDWYYENHPDEARSLQLQIRDYLAKLESLELKDHLFSSTERQGTFNSRLRELALTILGLPVFIWGWINNIIPYRIPRLVIKWLKPTQEFRATYVMGSGLIAYLLAYSLLTWAVIAFTGSTLLGLIYLATLVPSGKFALHYRDLMGRYRQHLRLLSLLTRRKNLVMELAAERADLLRALSDARETFMESQELPMKKAPA